MKFDRLARSLLVISVLLGCSGNDSGDDGAQVAWVPAGGANAGGPGDLAGSAACQRVDLVIAVDASTSMAEELQAMRTTVFPAFAERLKAVGAGLDDFRVATLDGCPQPASYHSRGSNSECNFESSSPWIESSSSHMTDEFSCVGDLYLADQECSGNNDDEQPASAVAAALEEPMLSGPNSGFRRNDALLIVIAITDEDEQPTGAERSPEEVYNRLVETVDDDPRRMVFVGAGGSRSCQGVYGEAEPANRLQSITELFGRHNRGVFWDLCEGRLEDGLEEAFKVIESACTELCGLDEDCGGGLNVPFCDEHPEDPSCNLG